MNSNKTKLIKPKVNKFSPYKYSNDGDNKCRKNNNKSQIVSRNDTIITDSNNTDKTLPKIPKNGYHFPRNENTKTEVILLTGTWDTSTSIPTLRTEIMHNVNIEEFKTSSSLVGNQNDQEKEQKMNGMMINNVNQNTMILPSPHGSDSGIEGDFTAEGNLSWLLNYKINELQPVDSTGSLTSYDENAINAADEVLFCYNNTTNSKDYFYKTGNPQMEMKIPFVVSQSLPKVHKPPFTYTELIEFALIEKEELTVSEIYQWISEHFSFFKSCDDRWKNSVRHNLSINPHFRKGSKSVQGTGHLWTIAKQDMNNTDWNVKKIKYNELMRSYLEKTDQWLTDELDIATSSILKEIGSKDFSLLEDEPMETRSSEKENDDMVVEYVNLVDVNTGLEDFLIPPVSKEQMAEECGLTGDFLITDLNPNTFGLNMSENDLMNTAANLYEDLNFNCYDLQNNQQRDEERS